MGEVLPHMDELAQRSHKQATQAMLSKLRNPLSVTLPLFDPDRFLAATVPLLRRSIRPWGFIAWLALVAVGAVLAVMHVRELTDDLFVRLLTAQNVALIVLVYPFVKVLHELGHAYAVKVWGGEVHEMGRHAAGPDAGALCRRLVVGGLSQQVAACRGRRAGIMVEVALAALAMIAWTLVEPGIVQAIAFNVMLICGISTVLFNGNPLLRFDGYYVMADLVEIPNLAMRASRYLAYLVQRYLFLIPDLVSPVTARGERFWFVAYAVGSFCYRMGVMIGVALVIANQFFFIGIALALWTVIIGLVLPIAKGLRYVAASPQLLGRRSRAWTVTGLVVGLAVILLLVVPVPYATVAQGIVWVPERSVVRARTAGEVRGILAPVGGTVTEATRLFELDDPELGAKADVLARQTEALELRLDAVRMTDQVQANLLREQIKRSQRRARPQPPARRRAYRDGQPHRPLPGARLHRPARPLRAAGRHAGLRGRQRRPGDTRRRAPGRCRPGAPAHPGRLGALRRRHRPCRSRQPVARGAGGAERPAQCSAGHAGRRRGCGRSFQRQARPAARAREPVPVRAAGPRAGRHAARCRAKGRRPRLCPLRPMAGSRSRFRMVRALRQLFLREFHV